jgi:serine protease Do
MSRRFLAAVVCLSATVGALLGLVVAGSLTPSVAQLSVPPGSVVEPSPERAPPRLVDPPPALPAPAPAPAAATPSFADIAERLNPAVVKINATSRHGTTSGRRAPSPQEFDLFGRPFEREPEGPRRGAGTGFLIDASGHILTNQHVIDGADRLTVRLSDGRSLSARAIGADPDTDVALLKVEAPQPLPFAPLGNSDQLRVGEWVVAIGNPLAYEHTVTVGIVSFLGRKLFNASLDRYIQTDAAINLGNSGGPLISARGEVVGINAAVSSRASNIGFAVPINQAKAILPQLREEGRVTRGYIGVALRDVDPDLRQSLGLRTSLGALVQDVTAGSPAARADLRPYDLIVAVDGQDVSDHDELIRLIAARRPGRLVTLQVLRDDRPVTLRVKLAERVGADPAPEGASRLATPGMTPAGGPALGMTVRDLDDDSMVRLQLPSDLEGVLVARVEPAGPAFDARIDRGHVLLEVNRQPVPSVQQYQRVIRRVRPGEVLVLFLYNPQTLQRSLHTLTLDR